MKLMSPYFLIGLVAIVVGLGLYFLDMFTFTMYGLPMTTVVLVVVGLILILLEIRKK
jgi:hypothetical protein